MEIFELTRVRLMYVWLMCFLPCMFNIALGGPENYAIPYVSISDCRQLPSDFINEYYDISRLQCVECDANTTEQVTSSDGLSCTCASSLRREDIWTADNRLILRCIACPSSQVQSLDGYSCVDCATSQVASNCSECSAVTDVAAELELNGDWLYSDTNTSVRECVTCDDVTEPILEERRCKRCNGILATTSSGQTNCICPSTRYVGGVCVSNSSYLEADNSALYTVQYDGTTINSLFFRLNIRAASSMCVDNTRSNPSNIGYSNLTACQLLGNMCVMQLSSTQYPPSSSASVLNDACSLHLRLTAPYQSSSFLPHLPTGADRPNGWVGNMPWLFYTDEPNAVLTDTDFTTRFNNSQPLPLLLAKYTVEGHFVGMVTAGAGNLILCQMEERLISSSLQFGKYFSHWCRLSVDDLFDAAQYATYFYDAYLQYTEGGVKRLYAVPLLNRNYTDPTDARNNREGASDNWQLTRRFYTVDRVTGQEGEGQQPRVISYAKSVKLTVPLRADGTGSIYPPYIDITYAQVTSDQYNTGALVEASFEVEYTQATDSVAQGLTIAMGVVGGLAGVYALFRVATWARRDGDKPMSLVTLFKVVLYASDTLANAFFAVISGFTIWWLIFYKAQSVTILVPDNSLLYYVNVYVGVAFTLKFISILDLIAQQVTTDVFLIDWEKAPSARPLPQNQAPTLRGASDKQNRMFAMALGGGSGTGRLTLPGLMPPGDQQQQQGPEVSMWRRCFVANEWNELQTIRRLRPALLLLLVVLLLDVVGLGAYGRLDPSATADPSPQDPLHELSPHSDILRYPMIVLCFTGVVIALWLFDFIFYSRFIDHPLRNFVDLCSTCNVSVMILTQDRFGYYIHGRTVHGRADVGLRQMTVYMKREEDNLCAMRGLLEGEREQTFEASLPLELRQQFNNILFNVALVEHQRLAMTGARTKENIHDASVEARLESYSRANKLFQNFIDHDISEKADYVVLRKSLLERILDTELLRRNIDTSRVGHFFYDNGMSFEKTLFYGHEVRLIIFLLLTFAIFDFICLNFVLDGILTCFIDAILVQACHSLSRRNIARKTMFDERFLI